MKKNAFAELLDGGQPLDVSGEIGAIDGKLNFVEFAFGRGRRRLQAREAVQACDFAQAMNLDDILQERVPRLLKLEGAARQASRRRRRSPHYRCR